MIPPITEQAKPVRVDADILRTMAASAMDDSFIRKLGLHIADPAVLEKLGGNPVKAMAIPYFDLDGKPTEFSRYRYLGETRNSWEVLANKKPSRYFQPANSGVHAYFPPLVNWRKIAEDPRLPIIITEGEKKAACATAYGFPTIGLGGVDCFSGKSFGPKRDGVALLPELEQIKWKDRDVIIIYDSDSSTNSDVISASVRLGRSLYAYKASPRIATLPPGPNDSKQGLDDFIVNCKKDCKSVQTTMELLLGTASHSLFEREIALYDFNSRFVYLRDLDRVICRDNESLLNPDAFVKRAFASEKHLEYTVKTVDKKLVEVSTYVPTAQAWMEWKYRASALNLDFDPLHGEFTPLGYNMWKGWPVTAKEGDVRLWTQLLDHLFSNSPVGDRRYFEQWCAYPTQHPGAKLKTAVLLWSYMEGNGKSTVLECLRAVYGSLFVPMNDSAVDLQYTDWLVNKLMVGVDDISAKNRDDHASKWRNLITAGRISVNKKYVNTFEVNSHVNFIMTSNEPNALKITPGDRRYFVHEAAAWGTKEECAQFCGKLYAWLENGGAANLLYHFQQLSLKGFDPAAPAPLTQSKLGMIEVGKGPLEQWVEDLCDAPDVVLTVGSSICAGALWTADDLVALYNSRRDTRLQVSRVTMGMVLAKAGIPRACDGTRFRLSNGRTITTFIVRDTAKWVKAAQHLCRLHYESTRGGK